MGLQELPNETPESFLDALFNRDDEVTVGPAAAVGIFDLHERTTSWHDNTHSVQVVTGAKDAFFSATLQSPDEVRRIAKRDNHQNPRWYSESAAAIGGLWLDVDVANSSHKKAGLFESDDKAIEFLYGIIAVPPSFVLKTGGGFHAWWRLSVPLIFPADDRERAAALVQAWQDFCIADAQERDYVVDSTFDLARMLRLPGTVNGKYGSEIISLAPIGTSSLECTTLHDVDTFSLLCGARIEEILTCSDTAPSTDIEAGPEGGLDVSCTPFKPTPAFIDSITEMSADFADLWERRRKLPSQSEYDLAIANQLVKLNRSDQEVTDALIVHRRDAGLEAKPRVDYYVRTLARAKSGTETPELRRERIVKEKKAATNRLKEDIAAEDGSDARSTSARIRDVNQTLGGRVNIINVLRYDGDPPMYSLETDKGVVTLGTVNCILQPNLLRNAIASITGICIIRHKAATWDPIAQAILSACEHVDLGEVSHPAAKLADDVSMYLDETRSGKARDDAMSSRLPWRDSDTGEVWGSLPDLVRWLHTAGEKVPAATVARRLRELGSVPHVFAYTKTGRRGDGERSSRSYWRLSGLSVAHVASAPASV